MLLNFKHFDTSKHRLASLSTPNLFEGATPLDKRLY